MQEHSLHKCSSVTVSIFKFSHSVFLYIDLFHFITSKRLFFNNLSGRFEKIGGGCKDLLMVQKYLKNVTQCKRKDK